MTSSNSSSCPMNWKMNWRGPNPLFFERFNPTPVGSERSLKRRNGPTHREALSPALRGPKTPYFIAFRFSC